MPSIGPGSQQSWWEHRRPECNPEPGAEQSLPSFTPSAAGLGCGWPRGVAPWPQRHGDGRGQLPAWGSCWHCSESYAWGPSGGLAQVNQRVAPFLATLSRPGHFWKESATYLFGKLFRPIVEVGFHQSKRIDAFHIAKDRKQVTSKYNRTGGEHCSVPSSTWADVPTPGTVTGPC